MTSLDNLHIKSDYERLIHALDPLWKIGRSVPTRTTHVFNRSLYYNRIFIAKFSDEDFHVFEKIYEFIKTEGYQHPIVIAERIRLELDKPETVTDRTIQEQIIKKGIVSKEQAKEYYPEAYATVYHDNIALVATKQVEEVYAVDPCNPEKGEQPYYKIGSVWVDKDCKPIDFRKHCTSTWNMRKIVRTGEATLEDAFYYTPGTCLEVVGDIAQHVLKTHIIPALYQLNQIYTTKLISEIPAEDYEHYESTIIDYYRDTIKLFDDFEKLSLKERCRYKTFLAFLKSLEARKKVLLNNNTYLVYTDIRKLVGLGDLDYTQWFKYVPQHYSEDNFVLTTMYKSCVEGLRQHESMLAYFEQTGFACGEPSAIDDVKYLNLHNRIKKDIKCLQDILTTNDPVIVKALTLPYTTGEKLQSESVTEPKVQTFQEFVFELQCRIYNVLSAPSKIVGFTFSMEQMKYTDPVYSHIQKVGEQAAPYMLNIFDILHFKLSGRAAHMMLTNRISWKIAGEQRRFYRNPTEAYIPFYAEKRKFLNTADNFNEVALYFVRNINDLCKMGLRDPNRTVTAFNYEGVRYLLNCATLKMQVMLPSCRRSSYDLYMLALDYRDGRISKTELKSKCNDPSLVEFITAEKNNAVSKINRFTHYLCKQTLDKLHAKYGTELPKPAWAEYHAKKAEALSVAIYRYLSLAKNSPRWQSLLVNADAKIEQFNDWLDQQKTKFAASVCNLDVSVTEGVEAC